MQSKKRFCFFRFLWILDFVDFRAIFYLQDFTFLCRFISQIHFI